MTFGETLPDPLLTVEPLPTIKPSYSSVKFGFYMGVLLGDAAANFLVTITSIFLFTRLAVSAKLLKGLLIFKVLPLKDDKNESKTPSPQRSGKQERKLARQANRQRIHIEGAEDLVRVPLPSVSIEGAHYYHELEYLIIGGVALILNFLLLATPLPEHKLASQRWPLWLSLGYPLLIGWAVLKVEFFTKLVSRRDKVFLAGLCFITTIAAVATIDRMSLEILDFQWAQAAREFNWTITTLLRKLAFSPAIPEVKLPFELLKVVLGLVAGMLSGLIAPGTVRLSKCLMLAMSPPLPTRPHLSTGVVPAAVMQLAVVLPVLGALFWVTETIECDSFMPSTCRDTFASLPRPASRYAEARPMVQELLGWSDASVQILRAGFMLLLAVVQVAAIRPFIQAYLNSGLVEWWTHKHAVTSPAVSPKIGEFITLKVDLVNSLICKVAVELVAPAVIWAACGVLLLYSIFKDGSQPAGWTAYAWPWYLSLKSPGEGPWVPTNLLTTTAGFLGWWTCCCWFGFTAIVLCMHRFGLLTA